MHRSRCTLAMCNKAEFAAVSAASCDASLPKTNQDPVCYLTPFVLLSCPCLVGNTFRIYQVNLWSRILESYSVS
jgi:hypothetical protein